MKYVQKEMRIHNTAYCVIDNLLFISIVLQSIHVVIQFWSTFVTVFGISIYLNRYKYRLAFIDIKWMYTFPSSITHIVPVILTYWPGSQVLIIFPGLCPFIDWRTLSRQFVQTSLTIALWFQQNVTYTYITYYVNLYTL